MPDQPIYKEFGKPMAESGTKLSDEVFNERYGTYKEGGVWGQDGSRENPAAKHDPKPFTGAK